MGCASFCALLASMKLSYDLHIHSCLSPCGDDEMTPNNIVGMSVLKGLDMIAVADHNAAFNLPAVSSVASEMGILLVPAVEVSTAEDVHLLGYFSNLERCLAFGQTIYDSLPDMKVNEQIFGAQQVLNEMDEPVGCVDKLLTQACGYGFEDCIRLIQSFGGVAVPAHVNKSAYSVFANLGFIPPSVSLGTVEVHRQSPAMGDVSMYRHLHSSDAHQLSDIAEPDEFLELAEQSLNCLIEHLR